MMIGIELARDKPCKMLIGRLIVEFLLIDEREGLDPLSADSKS